VGVEETFKGYSECQPVLNSLLNEESKPASTSITLNASEGETRIVEIRVIYLFILASK
jgi:hypothetical protein